MLAETGLFESHFLNTLVSQHEAGVRDHSAVLWALVMFESFLRDAGMAGGQARPRNSGAGGPYALSDAAAAMA